MAFRNWKNELDDKRPEEKRRSWPVWMMIVAAVVAAGTVCLVLWVWPGLLRSEPPEKAPSAEQIYISAGETGAGTRLT